MFAVVTVEIIVARTVGFTVRFTVELAVEFTVGVTVRLTVGTAFSWLCELLGQWFRPYCVQH